MRLTPGQQKELITQVIDGLRSKGRRPRSDSRGVMRNLGRAFGPLGELIGMIADAISRGTAPRKREIEDAIRILTEQGFRITPDSGGEAPPVIVEPSPMNVPTVRRPASPSAPGELPAQQPRPKEPAIPSSPWPDEQSIEILPRRVRGRFEEIPADVGGLSAWILTPQSSNVYAVAYDYDNKMLYVQYRAYQSAESTRQSVSICSGRSYTLEVRPNEPGPIYSYGGAGRPIPEWLFDAFAKTSSPGKMVWDKLRVCGSQFAHQVPYTLTDVPGGKNGYIPRKATKRGYRVRHVPTVGSGRRPARRSTLPPSR